MSPAPQAKNERDVRIARDRTLRALAASEREVARLDDQRAGLEREFADPTIYDDRARVAQLQSELDEVRRAAEAAFARWEELSNAAGEMTAAG